MEPGKNFPRVMLKVSKSGEIYFYNAINKTILDKRDERKLFRETEGKVDYHYEV